MTIEQAATLNRTAKRAGRHGVVAVWSFDGRKVYSAKFKSGLHIPQGKAYFAIVENGVITTEVAAIR